MGGPVDRADHPGARRPGDLTVWEPPPGFDDMLGDAELAPPDGRFVPLKVPGIGTVRARRPKVAAVPLLAMSVNPGIDEDKDKTAAAQADYMTLFVRTHLDDGEHERILEEMITGELPDNTVGQVARALATWGTPRPYTAVLILSFTAATHWRTIRTRLINNGIADPMAALPSMHSLLDVAEAVWLEALHTGDRDKDKLARDQLFDQLYAPELDEAKPVNTKGRRRKPPPPAGFDPATVEADFNSVRRMLGAR